MNYQLLQAIKTRLKTKVPEVNTIAEDLGQLESGDDRIAAAFPAIFMDIEYPECENVSRINLKKQKVDINITLRIAMKSYDNGKIDDNDKKRLNTIEDIHQAIQGWDANGTTTPFKRKSARPEKRTDLKVYEIVYSCMGTTN